MKVYQILNKMGSVEVYIEDDFSFVLATVVNENNQHVIVRPQSCPLELWKVPAHNVYCLRSAENIEKTSCMIDVWFPHLHSWYQGYKNGDRVHFLDGEVYFVNKHMKMRYATKLK